MPKPNITEIVGGMSLSRLTRPISAPPTKMGDQLSLQEAAYTSYYRRKSRTDPRLPLPNFVSDGQGSVLHNELIDMAFKTEKRSSLQGVDKNNKHGRSNVALMMNNSHAATLSELIDTAFSVTRRKTLVERIDEDHPESETGECKAESRCSTPAVGATAQVNRFFVDLLLFARKTAPFTQCKDEDLCYEMCCHQEGSRFIQRRLEVSTTAERTWFFSQLRNRLVTLCTDVFSNYVMQKFIGYDNFGEDILILVSPHLKRLSLDMYGCRVVQRLLESYIPDLSSLKGSVVELVVNQNGNHVVQKIIDCCGYVDFVLKEFSEAVIELCRHKYGCRAIQKVLIGDVNNKATSNIDGSSLNSEASRSMRGDILDNSKTTSNNELSKSNSEVSRSLRGDLLDSNKVGRLNSYELKSINTSGSKSASILEEIANNLQNVNVVSKAEIVTVYIDSIYRTIITNLKLLITDQYGNYVIQHIIMSGMESHKQIIYDFLVEDLVHYSIHKFASNVMEKLVIHCSLSQRKSLTEKILVAKTGKPIVVTLATNSYGNYVIQRLIEHSDHADRVAIKDVCRESILELKKSVYAKQILGKMFN